MTLPQLKYAIASVIDKILEKLPKNKVWINPDCGLKTRGIDETTASLKNLVSAAKPVRLNITYNSFNHNGRFNSMNPPLFYIQK